MGSKKHKRVVLSVIAAVVAIVTAVIGYLAVTNQQENTVCSAQGNGNTIECSDALSPSVEVVPGGMSGTWSLKLRNWEPNSEVELTVLDPAGQEMEMGEYGRRPVAADGTADNENGYYFWRHDAGEPTGTYKLVVSGSDTSGEQKSRSAKFEVG